MGIFDALTTAVAGLQAQSFALQNISGNIANSQTTGLQGNRHQLRGSGLRGCAGEQTSGGVIAGSVATNTVQGSIQSTSVSTDMAINGDGWFVVAQPTGFADNQPEFSGVNDYTRAGDFQTEPERLSGQRRRLLPDGHSGRPDDRESRAAASRRCCNSTTISCRRRRRRPSSIRRTCRARRRSGLLNPSDFEANPLAGAPVAAQIIGTGATLSPDAVAVGTGTVGTLTSATTLASLGITAGQTITVNDGTNTTTLHGDRQRHGRQSDQRHQRRWRRYCGGHRLAQRQRQSRSHRQQPTPSSITVGGTGTATAGLGFGAGQQFVLSRPIC